MARFLIAPTVESDRQFNRFVVVCLVIGFLALVVAGAAATLVMARNQRDAAWVAHTYEVEGAIYTFRLSFERAESARRGYMLTRDEDYARIYRRADEAILPALDHIQRLTADNLRQQRAITGVRELTEAQLARTRSAMADVRAGRVDVAVANITADGSVPIIRELRRRTDAMLAEEQRLLRLRDAGQAATARTFFLVISAAGLMLLIVGVLAGAAIRRYIASLSIARSTLQGLNDNLEVAVAERTADLQRANDEIQRFAYIVSHDLRSPLVNVMGFTAELETATAVLGKLIDKAEADAPHILSNDAKLAAREDLPEAIGFIRSSTRKMDRLINAILKLSREGRRVLTPERIDMTAMIGDIRSSIAHQIDDAGATVEIEPPLPGLFNDRVAVEQVFSNLIENAVKYLKPGRPGRITVRGHVDAGRLIYEVADNGRGIDPRDHDRVFDLFRRSGVQDKPGEGIGLAHVRALVYRLGGTIGCESALDQGAVFRVSLPAGIASEGDVRP